MLIMIVLSKICSCDMKLYITSVELIVCSWARILLTSTQNSWIVLDMSPRGLTWLLFVSCLAAVVVGAPTSSEESSEETSKPATGISTLPAKAPETPQGGSLTKRYTDDTSEESDEDVKKDASVPASLSTTATNSDKKVREAVGDTSNESQESDEDTKKETPVPASSSTSANSDRKVHAAQVQNPEQPLTTKPSTFDIKKPEEEQKDVLPEKQPTEPQAPKDLTRPAPYPQIQVSPPRPERAAETQKPVELTSTSVPTFGTFDIKKPEEEKRETEEAQKPVAAVNSPATRENVPQNKPANSPPVYSTLPASRPERDVEGQQQKNPRVTDEREKRDVTNAEEKTASKDRSSLKRPSLPTISEEQSQRSKRSAKAQELEARARRPIYKPPPGNSRPGFGNNRPGPGGPGRNPPRPGPGFNKPGYKPRPGGPGNNRPGPGHRRP